MKNIIRKTIMFSAFLLFSGYTAYFSASRAAAEEVSDTGRPVIAEIIIEGSKSVSENSILKTLSFKSGDIFDERKAVAAVQDLYAMDKFSDISVYVEEDETGNIKIIYNITEKPVIKKIEFRGNEEIRSRRLNREIDIFSGYYFEGAVVSAQTEKLKTYYRENGYAAVSIDAYTTFDEDNNEIEITFHVNEGNKIDVESLQIIGVLEKDYKKVRDLIELKSGKPYREKVLSEGIEAVKEHYRNNGYLHAEITGPMLTFDPEGRKTFITIFVKEGFQYKTTAIEISGNELITEQQIKRAMPLKTGAVYSEQNLHMSVASIQELYAEIGRVSARVLPSHDYRTEDREVDIKFEIYEGPEVRVRNIHIAGNKRTRDYVIRRHITVAEGEPFDLTQIRRSQERIFRLGFFHDVMLDMAPTEAEDEIDIIFRVEEQQTGMASIGAGYSSQQGVMGTLQVSQENFMGRGQRIAAMWEFGGRIQNYRLSFTEPYLFGNPMPFSASLYSTDRRRRHYTGRDYSERRRGGSVSLGRHFTNVFTGNLRYALEEVKIHRVSSAIKDDVPEEKRLTSSLTPRITFDTRDYPFDPRTGYYLRFQNQIAGGILGGDVNFSKFESKKTYFHPLYKNIVGVLNLETGAAWPYSRTDKLPAYESFYIGGSESVRGYEYYEIAGEYKTVLNAEIKFPIVRDRRQTILQGAVFYDVGGAWDSPYDASLRFQEGHLHRGYGAGIRFKTMAFPIRIDWGYGIDRPDPGGKWYFTMGDIF